MNVTCRERDAMLNGMERDYAAHTQEQDTVDRTEDRSLLLQDRAKLELDSEEELIQFFSCKANKQTLHRKTKSRTIRPLIPEL